MTSVRRSLSVLLVDDDPGDVLMIQEALEASEITREVHVANDGEEAIAHLRAVDDGKPRPDVMLLDLNMPKMGGREVLAQVKADPKLRTIPVVVLTTSQAPTDILESYALHANAYVTKPINLDELLDVVLRINDFFGRIAVLPD
jgi:CheY-like chemotaxis protein